MGWQYTPITASTASVTNRLVTSTNMKVGAYTVANASAVWAAGFHVTVTGTQVGGVDDTLGTVVFVGTDLNGQGVTETLTPVNGSTVEGSVIFRVVTSVTGVGWVINTGNDTLVCGVAGCYPMGSGGVLHSIIVNTTAAATVVLSDKRGTIATLKASIAENTYYYDVDVSGYLKVATTSTNDVTVTHSGTVPTFATS